MADFKNTFRPAAPTTQDGQRVVTEIVDKRVKLDVSDDIFQYDPNASSFTLLISKGGRKKRTVSQYIYNWLEKDRYFRYSNVTTGIDANDTSLTVDDPSIFYKNALVRNERTGEVFFVSATGAGSTNPLTIVRFDTNKQAMNAADRLNLLAPTYEEGARLGTDKSVKERLLENYTATIRTSYSWSGRDENSDMYGGNDPMTERKWQAVEHAISVEQAMWFSVKGSFTGPDGNKVTTMDGVHQFVKDNVWDVNGIPFTRRSLDEYLEWAMRYGKGGKMGSRVKYLFCAPRFLTELNGFAADRLQTTPKDKVFGIDASTYFNPHGRIILVPHPLFEDKGDIAYLMDLNHVRYVKHQGRDTRLLKSREENDRDGSREEIASDVSVQVELSKAHGFIRNLPL